MFFTHYTSITDLYYFMVYIYICMIYKERTIQLRAALRTIVSLYGLCSHRLLPILALRHSRSGTVLTPLHLPIGLHSVLDPVSIFSYTHYIIHILLLVLLFRYAVYKFKEL